MNMYALVHIWIQIQTDPILKEFACLTVDSIKSGVILQGLISYFK